MTYYEEQQIEAVDVGLITLRRRSSARNWMRVDSDGDPDHYSGAEYLAGFAGRDLVDRLDDDRALLDLELMCRPDLQVSQRLKVSESGWRVDHAELSLGAGLALSRRIHADHLPPAHALPRPRAACRGGAAGGRAGGPRRRRDPERVLGRHPEPGLARVPLAGGRSARAARV